MGRDELTFTDHLEELRWRFIRVFIVFSLAAAISFPFAKPILEFLIFPLGRTFFFTPMEAFWVRLKLSLFLGTLLVFPYLLWELWGFVAKGLLPHEKKYFLIYLPFSLIFFFLGIVFGYSFVLPLCLRFFLGFGSTTLQPMISINSYVSFLLGLLLSFGVVCELPVALLFLSHVGWVTPDFLIHKWRYAVVSVFVLAAVLTPPDVFSQLLLVIPIFLLYGVSIFFARVGTSWRRRRSSL